VEFREILSHAQWPGAWVVQEVVISLVVVVQRGPYQLDWDCLHTLLEEASFEDNLARRYAVDRASFTRIVRLLRHGKRAVFWGTDINTLSGSFTTSDTSQQQSGSIGCMLSWDCYFQVILRSWYPRTTSQRKKSSCFSPSRALSTTEILQHSP
jgi:hypothetical protein